MILEAKIRFLKELKERQKIKIMSDLILTFGLFDLKARKLIAPTEEWNKAIGVS